MLGIAAGLFLVWIIWDNGYDRGVERTTSLYETAIAEERARQEEIFRNTVAARDEALAQLREKIEVRDATIERLNREATESANADRESLDANSVCRLQPWTC